MHALLFLGTATVQFVGGYTIAGWARAELRKLRKKRTPYPGFRVVSSSEETWINGELWSRKINGKEVFSARERDQ